MDTGNALISGEPFRSGCYYDVRLTQPTHRDTSVMSYKGLEAAASASEPHLGGNIKLGDPYTYCPSVWDYLLSRFSIETAMDLGSGTGIAASYLSKRGVRVVAVDGFEDNLSRSVYPTLVHDLTKG